ncbi:MAG: HEAT repeat domain-containing protein [Chloroflexota bacterium]|nr:HEAT repeat domain-containing protein [Chloroflexota bacterium]
MAEERNPFQAQIDKALRDLASLNANKRRDAAYLMGEVAYEDSIPTLVNLYKSDKSPGVRRAAAYALGQFRAIEIGMSQGEQAKITALLREVETSGNLGRRAPTAARARLALALILSLVLIGVLFTFQNVIAGRVLGGRTDRIALLADVRGVYTRINDDTRTLQSEYLNVISGRSLGCVSFFNDPPSYTLDARDANAYGDIAAAVDQINQVGATVKAARVPYDGACNGDPAAFAGERANDAYRGLVPVLPQLADIELALTAAEANTVRPTAIPPTPIPTTPAPPTITPLVTLAPTAMPATAAPTTAPLEIGRVLPPVYAVIDDVTAPRGAATLLVAYWEEVGLNSTSAGCTVSRPEIPEDIVIAEDDLALSFELQRAVQVINNSLEALRSGWTDFVFACNSGANELFTRAPGNLANARASLGGFSNARALLDALRALSDGSVIPSATP